MSGAAIRAQTPAAAAANTEVVFEALGIGHDLEQLRTIDVTRIIEVEATLQNSGAGGDTRGFSPVLGPSLPQHPVDAIRAGSARDVATVIGCTTDEMMSFMIGDPELWTIDDDGLTDRLRTTFGDQPFADVLDRYRAARPGESPTSLLLAITTDRMMRVPHIRVAEAKVDGGGAPTFMYLFAWGRPDPTGRIRSGHGSDMPYFFDNLDKAPMADGPHAAALIRATCGTLIALAHTGDPNHDALPDWPTYTATDRATMLLDVESAVELDPFSAETRAWDDTELARRLTGS